MTTQTNQGHRKRVKEKFLASLGKELHDYELLEILLFAANARADTKPLAKQLIAEFGDLSALINCEVDRLKNIAGVGDSTVVHIKIIAEIISRVLKKSARRRTILNNWQVVLDYAQAVLGGLNHEVFRVLFLDKKLQLIADELVCVGENDHVFVSAKLIAKKALLLQASSVILMHNHPSGDSRASAADIKVTQEISNALKNLEIRIIDHLIIGAEGYFSFKENGFL